jgi:hypothetical protein
MINEELRLGFFLWNRATAHTVRATLVYLQHFYDNQIHNKSEA